MGATKVLLDTNILISALGWESKPKEIFQKCIEGKLELVTSPEQIVELKKVLDYPKFNLTEKQKEIFIAIILEIATIAEITGKIKIILEDPDDDIIIESAVVGNANYIITGDSHLLKLKKFAGISIITAAEFLNSIS